MERKTVPKPAPPPTSFSGSEKVAPKAKPVSSQKVSAKAKVFLAPGKTYKKAEGVEFLKHATAKITKTASETLPTVPHILSIPLLPRTQDVCSRYSLNECSHPLFSREEFSALQYMTLLESADREWIHLEPGWILEENGISPASSGEKTSRTPNGEVDAKKPTFKRKIKFGDYNKLGLISTSHPDTVTVMEQRLPGKPSVAKDGMGTMISSRHNDVPNGLEHVASASAPASAGSRPYSAQQDHPHIKAAITSDKHSKTQADSTFPETHKPAQNSTQSSRQEKPGTPASNTKAVPNGVDQAAPKSADISSQKSNLKRSSPNPDLSPAAKKAKVSVSVAASAVVNRPMSNGGTAKRPLPDDSPSVATKKVKLSNGVQSKNLGQLLEPNNAASKSSQENGKKENAVKVKQEKGADSHGKKPAASKSSALDQSKSTPTSASKSAATKLPPLLSPTLPPQVIAANHLVEPAFLKSSTAKVSSNSPKPSTAKVSSNSPKPNPTVSGMAKVGAESSKARLPMPRLLSPDLPPIVEAALAAHIQAREAKEAAEDVPSSEKHVATSKKTIDTVAERHEKSRQPNALGIARPVKNGKSAASTRALDATSTPIAETSKEQKPDSVLKLKYKKKQRKDIERILKLRPNPAAHDHLPSESNNKNVLEETSVSRSVDRPSTRDERRGSLDKGKYSELNGGASKRLPASSTSQKRPRAEEPTVQASNKRLKPSDVPQSSKPSTPLTPASKPSVPSAPSSAQKTAKALPDTPKKGDALKATAMRKMNSSDSHARTPQSTQPSLPASSEKPSNLPRNGFNENNIEAHFQLAKETKRNMDRILQIKQVGGIDNVSKDDLELGKVVGLECTLAWMIWADAHDTHSQKPLHYQNWHDICKLHNYIAHTVQGTPKLDILSLQILLVVRSRMSNGFAFLRFVGIDPGLLTQTATAIKDLWRELDQKMSDESAQSFEESTSRTKKGFNPGGNFKEFVATSLRKLKRYATTQNVQWESKLIGYN